MKVPAVTLYTYAKCSTCRDAARWLRAHDIVFVGKPIYDTPPTVPELRQMLRHHDGQLRRLFNTSGIEYRAQRLAEKLPQLSTDEALQLLANNGRLVKRPFLLGRDLGLLGFNEEKWAEAFGRGKTL